MKWTGWTTLALGFWLIVAPSALGYAGLRTAVISDGAFGAIILGLSAWGLAATSSRATVAFSWVLALAGVWVAGAPFLLEYDSWQSVYAAENHAPYLAAYAPVATATVNDVIVGVVVAALGVARAVGSGSVRIRV